MKRMKTLNDLLTDLVKDIYYAEKQIVKTLPKMIKAAHDGELIEAFESHLEETHNHITRLESIFEELGISPRAKKCPAIEGIIEEGKEVLNIDIEPDVLDSALIVTGQKVEHYEMASYGSIRTFAETLGLEKVVRLAQETLNEEGDADKKLTEIADHINERAAVAVDAKGRLDTQYGGSLFSWS